MSENNLSKKKNKMKSSNLESYFNKKGKTQTSSSSLLVGPQNLSGNYPSRTLTLCVDQNYMVNAFSSFDKLKLLKLAKLYLDEFSSVDLLCLDDDLDTFVCDMRRDDRFQNLKDIGKLSVKLVETNKDELYRLVYLLIKMVLIFPVATASVESAFSATTYVKNKLRNSIEDQFLNDCLVTYIEGDVFLKISNEDILNHFQGMRTHREQL